MGPASAAIAAGMSTRSAVQRRLQQRPRATAAAIVVTAAGSGAIALHARSRGLHLWPAQRRYSVPLPLPLVHGPSWLLTQEVASARTSSIWLLRSLCMRVASSRRFLHPMAVHAISGAAGEIVQIAALYPLDTIKVRTTSR